MNVQIVQVVQNVQTVFGGSEPDGLWSQSENDLNGLNGAKWLNSLNVFRGLDR